MHATLYKPLSESAPTWAEVKITDIFKIISYNYTKKFYEVGSFSMVIPVNEPSAELLETNTFLATGDGDYLFVTDIKEKENRITLEGHDLKYLLAGRITLFPTEEQDKGTYGYYVTQGSTGKCIGDIVRHNITEASDPNRRIFGFSVSDSPHGLQNDTYMTRLEPLDQVVGTLCKNAGIGYDVTMEIGSEFGDSIKFTVIKPTDRSADQTDVPRVIFSKGFLNVENLSREIGVDSEKNAIYAVNGSNIDDAVVKLVNRDGEGKADYGVYRRETTVNVNCDIDEIDSYALKEAEDCITTDSFAMEVMAAESYKKDWFVGDIVTFRHKGINRNVPIIAAEIQRTAEKFTVKLSAGETVTRPVSMVNRTANKAVNEITQKKFDDGYVTVVKELPEVGKKNKIYVLEEDRAVTLSDDSEAETGAEAVSGYVYVDGEWKRFLGEDESGAVGKFTNEAKNSEIFNDYEDNYINPNTPYAHISGRKNTIDYGGDILNFSFASSILGGAGNVLGKSALYSVIVAGTNNQIIGSYHGIIGAGAANKVEGYQCGVFCGTSNTAKGVGSGVFCGSNNEASGSFCAIFGGRDGKIDVGAYGSVILCGLGNEIKIGNCVTVFGQQNIVENGLCDFVGGYQNIVKEPKATIRGRFICGFGGTLEGTTMFAIGGGGGKNIVYADSEGNLYAKSFNIIGAKANEASELLADTNSYNHDLSEQLTKIKADIEALKAENTILKAEIELLKAR